MAGKPKLHYFNARGRMESIRWLLAAVGVEFEEKYMKTREDLEKLRKDGVLMFQQVPMVEIDGMKLVQTRAIFNYIANKHNLYGKDIKERALIDMYTEGIVDLNELVLIHPFLPPGEREASLTQIKDKAKNRYFPAFEKVLKSHGQDYLVGNRLSKADILLVELLYNVEELDPSAITSFPLLQVLKSHRQDYLVGNRLSKADILLVELLYNVEELDPSMITSFPLLQGSISQPPHWC